uniref:Amine GPCR, putative n=1 Tax=Schistosoma mansoni TaxID=6183 RepID=A0A3Q0KDN0_SCHMA
MDHNVIVNLPIRITVIIEGLLGTIFNSAAIIIVFKTQFGSKLTTCMLRAQPIFDFFACLFTAIYYITQCTDRYNKLTGLYIIDILICHTWFRNAYFWLSCTFSVQNLVCISVDRVSSVIFPRLYKTHSCQFTVTYFAYMILMSLFLYMPAPILRRYMIDHCEMDFSFQWIAISEFLDFMVYSWIIFAYFIPVLVMLISHIWVIQIIRKFHSSRHTCTSQNNQSTLHMRRKISQLVITTAILSGQLALLHSYEAIRQILIANKIMTYDYQSITGHLGPILILLGCVLNPCVLILTTATLRRRLSISIKHFTEKISISGKKDKASS